MVIILLRPLKVQILLFYEISILLIKDLWSNSESTGRFLFDVHNYEESAVSKRNSSVPAELTMELPSLESANFNRPSGMLKYHYESRQKCLMKTF